jgi:hypothetical protein
VQFTEDCFRGPDDQRASQPIGTATRIRFENRSQEKTRLLTDGPTKDSAYHIHFLRRGKSIWFVRPIKDIIDPLVDKSEAETLYMPSWSLEELRLCNRLVYKIDERIVDENYQIFGGIPQYDYDEKSDVPKSQLESALKETNLNVLARQNCYLDEPAQCLLVIQPVGHCDYTLVFISHQVEEIVTEQLRRTTPNSILSEFFKETLSRPEIAGVQEVLLKDLSSKNEWELALRSRKSTRHHCHERQHQPEIVSNSQTRNWMQSLQYHQHQPKYSSPK